MLNYQSTSFHDVHYLRQLLGLRPAPEFEGWLRRLGLVDEQLRLQPVSRGHRLLQAAPGAGSLRGAP
jgi:ethanolamine ammonia-lyase large subunit